MQTYIMIKKLINIGRYYSGINIQYLLCLAFQSGGSRPNPDSKVIEAFLKDRVIPENRDYLKHILEANGIYEYNWKELIKLNKGRTTDDPYRVETHEPPKEP